MIVRTVIAVLVFCAVSQGAAPTGLLSTVSGDVKIVRAGETTPRPARIADLISAGDRVLTGPNSQATFLFCPESRTAKMLADAEVQFDAAAIQVKKGKLSDDHKLPSCRLPANLSLAGASQVQAGVLRLRGSDLTLLSPSRTNIATLLPHFRWEPMDGATGYELKVMDREEKILWRQSGSATDAAYPATAPALAWDQKYLWRVSAHDADDTLTDVGSYFQVLPKDQADQVRSSEEGLRALIQANPADNSPMFLLAFLYEDNGMLDEAARIYGELAKKIGPQDWVQTQLTGLMNKLGWSKPEYAIPH